MNKVSIISAALALTIMGSAYAQDQTGTQSTQETYSDHTVWMLSKLHSYNADAIDNNSLAIEQQQQQIDNMIDANAQSLTMLADLHHNNYLLTEDNKNAISKQRVTLKKQTSQVEINNQHISDITEQAQRTATQTKANTEQNNRQNTKIDENSGQISANTHEIHNLGDNMRSVNQSIDQVELDFAANAKNIASNKAAISGLQQDFTNMKGYINGAYAESAAFAGLVNPYGVGKFAISASIGHHEDQEAVAIGIGERFNENVTAKLGGAYDTASESVSVYAGIGFEF